MPKQKCQRPTCDRAIPGQPHQYQGLCFKHALTAGIAHNYQAADTAHDLVHRAMSDGWTVSEICRVTGVNQETIRKIRDRGREFILHSTVIRLSCLPDQPPRPASWPISRRLQSLRAIGIPICRVADELGLNVSNLVNISCGRVKSVSRDVDRMIRGYYRQHEMDLPKSVDRNTEKARHPLPLEWVDIDDPQEHRGMLTPAQFHDLIPVPDDLPDAARFLLGRYGVVVDAASVVGVSHVALPRVADRRNANISREYEHRIRYAAQREGWVSGAVAEVAA